MSKLTRRRLLLALAAAPLAASLPGLKEEPAMMSVGEAIAWLHRVGYRPPSEQG